MKNYITNMKIRSYEEYMRTRNSHINEDMNPGAYGLANCLDRLHSIQLKIQQIQKDIVGLTAEANMLDQSGPEFQNIASKVQQLFAEREMLHDELESAESELEGCKSEFDDSGIDLADL